MIKPEVSSLVETFLTSQVDIALENLLPPTLIGKHEELISQQLTQRLLDAWRQEVIITNENTDSISSSPESETQESETQESETQTQTDSAQDDSDFEVERSLMAEEDINMTLIRGATKKLSPSRTPKKTRKPSPYNLFCKDHPHLSKIETAKLWTRYRTDKSQKNLLQKYY